MCFYCPVIYVLGSIITYVSVNMNALSNCVIVNNKYIVEHDVLSKKRVFYFSIKALLHFKCTLTITSV